MEQGISKMNDLGKKLNLIKGSLYELEKIALKQEY